VDLPKDDEIEVQDEEIDTTTVNLEPPKIPEVEETPDIEPKAPSKDEVDRLKEKLKGSSQEALVLHFKNQKLVDTIDEAESMPEPTEDEVKDYATKTGADWDLLDDLTKVVLRDTLWNKKRFGKISEANKEAKNITDWVGKVDHFTESPEVVNKYPELLDNAEDFRAFAIKPSRRGGDLDDLATSFLYGLSQSPEKKKKGSILMAGGSGAAAPVKPEGITEDQAAMIRKKDMKEYRRLIKEGKIKIQL
jgi:hypothetical protein